MESTQSGHENTSQVCSVCGAASEHLQQMMIGHTQERAIIHVTCTQCRHTVMIYSAQNDMGGVTFGVLTDMVAQEAHATMHAPAISSDDVLAAHRYFQRAQIEAHITRK